MEEKEKWAVIRTVESLCGVVLFRYGVLQAQGAGTRIAALDSVHYLNPQKWDNISYDHYIAHPCLDISIGHCTGLVVNCLP